MITLYVCLLLYTTISVTNIKVRLKPIIRPKIMRNNPNTPKAKIEVRPTMIVPTKLAERPKIIRIFVRMRSPTVAQKKNPTSSPE